jgi:hypothetical protein
MTRTNGTSQSVKSLEELIVEQSAVCIWETDSSEIITDSHPLRSNTELVMRRSLDSRDMDMEAEASTVLGVLPGGNR